MHPLPLLAREPENRIVAAQPSLNQVPEVRGCFGFLAEAFDACEVVGFGFEELREADEGGGEEEVAEEGFVEGGSEGGEGEEGLGGYDGGVGVGGVGSRHGGGWAYVVDCRY